MKETAPMYDEIMGAWCQWTSFWAKERGTEWKGVYDEYGCYEQFKKLIGADPFKVREITDGAAEKIKQLNGPHAHTLLKVRSIQMKSK
jgi:hypothetical protein